MKKIKNFTAMIIVMITIFANATVAYAAPQTMPDGNVFDPEYYAANNPDVVAAVGTDTAALYNHYKTCGIKEGRLPYDGAVTISPKVGNVSSALAQARYDAFFMDVIKVYTNDPAVFFDANYYLANYPDLATTVGTDYKALFNHYINIGRFEGRTARAGIYPERKNFTNFFYSTSTTGMLINKMNSDLQFIDWLNSVVNDSMTEREIVTVIHDEICNRVTYGNVAPNYGALLENESVFENFKNGTSQYICGGYAGLFSKILSILEIKNQYVVDCTTMDHAWNRVMIDGVWYDVDVTWDDCLSNKDYFLVPAGTGVFAERQVDYISNGY